MCLCVVLVETRLRWFEHVERILVDLVVRVAQMEGSQITSGTCRPRKTIRKDLEINELEKGMIFDRTPWHHLIF